MSAPLSAGLQGAHAALLGHANEVRALAHLANFETRIDDVGFEWIETMLLHARTTFEKYCLTEDNPPSDDITLGTQAAAITLASEMLKTPSRRRAHAALFPGGAAAASRRRAAPAASSDSADKENAPVALVAAESASSSSGTTGLGIGARSTRSRADKSEIIKMPNPFASKKSAPEKSSSDKDAPLSDKPAKAAKKALKDAVVPQPVASSSSSADAGPSSAEEPSAPAKKAKKGTKASAAAAAKAAAKAARDEEAAAEPKPAKRKAAKGKAAAASDVESTKPAAPVAAPPAPSASSKAPTPPAAPVAAMPRAASQFFDVDDDNSHDLDATMAHESEAVRASTPLPAGAKKGVPTTRSREESLELIAPSHASDSDDDAQELVSAREKLSETSGSPVLPAEEPTEAKLPAAEKPAAKATPAEPIVAAPKRTLGDYGASKKNAPAAAVAASAATTASSSSTSNSSTHASSTPAAPAFRSSFLNKSLRKAVTSAQEADQEADSELDDSDEPPLRAGKRAAKAATSANTRANATAASSRTRAAAKRKSDEMEAPTDVEEAAAAAAARPQKSAKLAASMQLSDPPRTLGTVAAPSTAAAPPTTAQSGFDAIRSRLENVRRISGAHRGNAAAALPSSTSAAGSTHVGLGASLATSIFAARPPGAASAAAPAPTATAAAAAPPAVAPAGTRVRDSDDAAEWQDSTGEPSLESANDDFVAAIKAKAEQFQAEVAASKAAPALPAKDDDKATAPAPAAATSTKPAPAPVPTGSTTPVHSPTAAAPAALPPLSAVLNADDECAVATESESEGEAGADDVVLQPRAAAVARRADDEMTLDELVAGSAKAPAPSDKGKAAAARPAPAATSSASVGPSSAYAAQQARNNLGATNGSTAARPLASMPKVSVNLTGKSAAVSKSLHRSQQAPAAAAQAQQQRRDEAAREKQREETAHAAAQPSDSGAHAAASAPGRGGWGILDKAKGFLGFNGGMPSSASGFMPSRPGAAASSTSGSKVPVAPSSPGKSPRKNSAAGPGGNLAASTASQGKPASLARAEAARRREAEEADRRRREKDERRTAAQAEKDAKSKADAEREAERRKRAREPEANRPPMARVPEMAQSKNKAPVSIAVAPAGKSQVRKDDEAGGKKRRVSDDGASVPGDGGASALARSTAAAPPPAGTAAFKPARPGAPSTASSANARPPQLQASASGIPRGAGFASQQYQQQHAQQQLQQAQAARAAQAAAAAAASIQRPVAPRPMPPAASAAARPAPPVVAREVTPEIVLSDPNSEYSDSDASDVEERRAKERPWEREELQAALLAQATRDPDAIFGIPHGSVPAHEWFANHGSRREMEQTQQRLNRPRSSSGTWTRGDALGQAEIDRYNLQMGIVSAGVRLPEQRSSARPSPRAPPRPSTLALDAAAQARASQQQGPSRAGAPGSSRP